MTQCLATKAGHSKIIRKTKENCEKECDYYLECYPSKVSTVNTPAMG